MIATVIALAAAALVAQPSPKTVWTLQESSTGSMLTVAECEDCVGGLFTLECRRATGDATLTVFGLYPEGEEGALRSVIADVDGARHIRTVRLTGWSDLDSAWLAEAVLNQEDPLIDAIAEGATLTLSAGVGGEQSGPIGLSGARVHIDEWRGLCLRAEEPAVGARSAPPPVLESAGPFSARPLPARPAMDRAEWMPADVHTSPAPARQPVGDDASLRLVEPDRATDTGDLQRYELYFDGKDGPSVRLDDGLTGWVYVTPDGRYVISEPLYVLDVAAWKQYALHAALDIPNYTSIEAISRDGRRVLVSRRACAIDCPGSRDEWFELRLP